MKASELRIGNWIMPDFTGISKQEPLQVTGMFIQQCSRHGEVSNYNGIPLTPEILKKAGFVKGEKREWRLNDPHFKCLFLMQNGENSLAALKGVPMKMISYVHQLQNLYFAMTGEELPVEL